MPKPGVPRNHSKDEILDVAQEMLREHGPDGFSVRALAKRIGLSPMGLYTYFPSRECIMSAVLDRFASSLDIKPIAGERWNETVERTTDRMLAVAKEHPQMLNVNYNLRNTWARSQYRLMYALHKDQGMPDNVYTLLYCGMSALNAGYFNGCMQAVALRQELEADGREPTPWENVALTAFTEDAYIRGRTTILRAVQKQAAPDPCEWYTPNDPETWIWKPAH